jgi:hypothetical protein
VENFVIVDVPTFSAISVKTRLTCGKWMYKSGSYDKSAKISCVWKQENVSTAFHTPPSTLKGRFHPSVLLWSFVVSTDT